MSRLMIGLLFLGLLSCGYHLRGQSKIHEQALPVYLFADDVFHDLRRALAGQLKRSEVATTKNKTLASTVITILSVKKSNSVISVDTLGRTSEVELRTTVNFSFTINQILFKKKIHVFKDVAFNPENILAYKKEEKILYDEMFVEVSRLILLQLQAKANSISRRAF